VGKKVREKRLKTAVADIDRINDRVEKSLSREIKHLATKEDLKTGLAATERRLIYWMVGILITILLLGFIATLVGQRPPTTGSVSPQARHAAP